MRSKSLLYRRPNTDRGASLVIVALSMVFLLGMLGLGIDLATLYVGRTQAQRTADAAALAGAQAFTEPACTSSGGSTANCQALATDRALTVGNQNLIAGANPNMSAGDLSFNFSNPENPQVTAVAARDTAHGNPMPTFFMKIFGIQTVDVSTSATAEAYNMTGGPMPVGVACVKPWLTPNCNTGGPSFPVNNPQGVQVNTNCPDPNQPAGYYFACYLTPCGPNDQFSPTVQFPGLAPTGIVGETINVKPQDPSQANAPSKFYTVLLPQPPSSTPMSCPSCATNNNGSGGTGGTGTNSGALYAENIMCCNPVNLTCGPINVTPVTGNKNGPTSQGVDCLINQGSGQTGQDTIDVSSYPFKVTAGSNNPLFPGGSPISLSDSSSTVALPIYSGMTLCPGGSCPSEVTTNILGFLQVFITNEQSGNVYANIVNISACSQTGGGSNTVISGGSSPVPVRLIHP